MTTRNKDESKHRLGGKPKVKFSEVEEERAAPHQSPRVQIKIKNGTAIIGSDGHYIPQDPAPVAHRAFVYFAKTLKPQLVCYNGDACDFSQISRHPPIGWEKRPTVQEELEEVQQRLHEIELAAPRGCALSYNLANHDVRFETRLATAVPEYANVPGFRLRDHVGARWQWSWATWINNDVVVKHRWKGGIHAPWNNALHSGKTILSGHLHSLKVYPVTDFAGTRWGVDCGTLADPFGKQFENYTEDNARNWRAGFAVLTWNDGRLLWPEVVAVVDENHIQFRGQVIRV
jgi:hypothetical protein